MDKLASEILAEYKTAVDEFVEQELLIDSRALVPFESREGTVISWSGGAHLSYLFGEYSTLDHYRAILEQGDFCLCFADGGLVQIRYDIQDETIVSHRLCYFPCPYLFVPVDLENISLADLPFVYNAEELRTCLKLTTPIRFDFDAEISDERHAHSHFSINKESCRVPTYGPVSLGHFFRFVFRYFYESEFSARDEWDDFKPRFYRRTLPHPSPHELHFESSVTW